MKTENIEAATTILNQKLKDTPWLSLDFIRQVRKEECLTKSEMQAIKHNLGLISVPVGIVTYWVNPDGLE